MDIIHSDPSSLQNQLKKIVPAKLRPFLRPFRKYYLPYLLSDPEPDSELAETVGLVKVQDTVVEVGANVGGLTRTLAAKARWVTAFEPNPLAYKILRRNTRRYPNVNCLNYALGSKESTGYLRLAKDSTPVSRCASVQKDSETGDIPIERLDYVAGRPTVLFIDCEGAETEVITGGVDVTSKARLIIVETHFGTNGGTLGDIRDLLKDYDVRIVKTAEEKGLGHWESVAIFEK